jgi:hypothetical protein
VIGFNRLCRLPHFQPVSVSVTPQSGSRNRSVPGSALSSQADHRIGKIFGNFRFGPDTLFCGSIRPVMSATEILFGILFGQASAVR